MPSLPTKETLTVEFKSDRDRLPDDALVEAIVCLANGQGGTLYLGIEKDGTVTGLHASHKDISGLPALVENRTSPSVSVMARLVQTNSTTVAAIEVPMSRVVVATSGGKAVRRRLNHINEPECVPMLPHEFASRLAHFGGFDFSGQTVPGLGPEALDPLERVRLRRTIEANLSADKTLLKLTDDELDGALRFIAMDGGKRCLTYAGLLVIGREDHIAQHVPTHEVAFQVFKGTKVAVNDFSKAPLIRVFEQLESYYRAHALEQEVQVGLFRVAVPNVDRQAFREAVVNAVTHRDYTMRGQVYIQWRDDVLSISSPGGFLEGITPDNLLSHPPSPRNEVLANAFKRIGLAERTGRGVDIIYEGLVKYGRPRPRYDRSTAATVVVDLSAAEANLKFVELIAIEQQKRGKSLPLSALVVAQALLTARRATAAELVDEIKVLSASEVKQQLELLVEAGLVQAHGVAKGRTYTMSAAVYSKLGKGTDYTRQAGISAARQEAMILDHVEQQGKIRRDEVIDLCGLAPNQATKLLTKLKNQGKLVKHGEKRWAYYTRT
ncbi:MAG: ATP-binding protein [Hyphomicrobiaceae bacterium]